MKTLKEKPKSKKKESLFELFGEIFKPKKNK